MASTLQRSASANGRHVSHARGCLRASEVGTKLADCHRTEGKFSCDHAAQQSLSDADRNWGACAANAKPLRLPKEETGKRMGRGYGNGVIRRCSGRWSGSSMMQSFRNLVVGTLAGAAILLLAGSAPATPGGLAVGTSAAQCVRG